MKKNNRYDIIEVPEAIDVDGTVPAKFLITCPDIDLWRTNIGVDEDSPEVIRGVRCLYVASTRSFLSFKCYSDARTVVDALNGIIDGPL
jgi:hypothetical protein